MSAHVLLVEDERFVAELVRLNLEHAAMRVEWAPTYGAARRHLEAETVPVLLLDLMLPDGDGADLLAWSKQAERASWVTVISALGSGAENRVSALSAGADDYLPKPFDVEELVVRTRRALARVRGSTVPQAVLATEGVALRLDDLPRPAQIVLRALARNAGYPMPESELLNALRKSEPAATEATLARALGLLGQQGLSLAAGRGEWVLRGARWIEA